MNRKLKVRTTCSKPSISLNPEKRLKLFLKERVRNRPLQPPWINQKTFRKHTTTITNTKCLKPGDTRCLKYPIFLEWNHHYGGPCRQKSESGRRILKKVRV